MSVSTVHLSHTQVSLSLLPPPPTLSHALTRFLTHLLTLPSSLPPSLPIAQADSEEAKKELTTRQKRRQRDKARKAASRVQRGGGGGDGEDTATASTGGAAAVPASPLNGWLQELDEAEETLKKVMKRQMEYESGEVAKFDEEADDEALLRHVFGTIDKDGNESISRKELDDALQSSDSKELVDALKGVIKDGEDGINFNAFKSGADQVRA
jgi:hypothetical protein